MCVKRVWQVAHTSEDWMCAASVGEKVEADRMTRARPLSTTNGPNTRRWPGASV